MAYLLPPTFLLVADISLFHFIFVPLFSAVQYKLPDHLRLQRAQSVTLKASTHVQGTSGETPSPQISSHHAQYPNPSTNSTL